MNFTAVSSSMVAWEEEECEGVGELQRQVDHGDGNRDERPQPLAN